MTNLYEAEHEGLILGYGARVSDNIFELRFSLEYQPLIEMELFTFRERKEDDELTTFQFYNQDANVVSNEVLGDLHDKVIKKGSGSNMIETYLHKNISDRLPIHERAGEYIITSRSTNWFKTSSKIVYNLDKFYSKLQKYIGVLEKYRQYAIPNESIVKRQITINVFGKFSDAPAANTSKFFPLRYLENSEYAVDMLRFGSSINSGVVLPLTSFAFNNSLVFEAVFESNVKVGDQSSHISSSKRVNKPVIYTDANGRINGNRYVAFSRKFSSFEMEDSYDLPDYNGTFRSSIYINSSLSINKDARENLAISLQLHHIDTTGKIYLNGNYTKECGLIGGEGFNTNDLFVVFLNKRPFETKQVTTSDIISSSIADFQLAAGNNSVELPTATNLGAETSASWAVVKQKETGIFDILFWVDEQIEDSEATTQYYINFDDKY
jgi:hypothetical protein